MQHEVLIRVRYCETDAQGRLHHANFINYFELGRTEQMRELGQSYREFEQSGLLLVVKQMTCEYLRPVNYDDLLTLRTIVTKARGARLEHRYELYRGEELVATGASTLACISADGRVQRLPEWLQEK
jgi:acyl-CoA thioester hydrolase